MTCDVKVQKNCRVILSCFQNGFTIIEMVVVILLLGILSATVVPRFFSSSGFEEYGYRTQVISVLRTVQLRAMQQAQINKCHTIKVGINVKNLGLLATDNSSDKCDESNIISGPTSVDVDSNHAITFNGSNISFDQMGRPDPSTCADPCQILINGGEKPLTIKIESEGYIHASN